MIQQRKQLYGIEQLQQMHNFGGCTFISLSIDKEKAHVILHSKPLRGDDVATEDEKDAAHERIIRETCRQCENAAGCQMACEILLEKMKEFVMVAFLTGYELQVEGIPHKIIETAYTRQLGKKDTKRRHR